MGPTGIAIALSLSMVFASHAAEAQQLAKLPRIGFVGIGSPSATAPLSEAFLQGLRDLGYVDGQNFLIEYRYAEGDTGRVSALVNDLISLKVDVLVAGSPSAHRAAKRATTTIPVVMAQSLDPVGTGLINSLAQPGGNITGLTSMADELDGKRLELLKQAIPQLIRVAFLRMRDRAAARVGPKELQVERQALGLRVQVVEVERPEDFDTAFSAITKERAQALLITRGPFVRTHTSRIVDFAKTRRLPTMWDEKLFVEAGGLMSYGPDFVDLYRRAATYVDKILKGSKPADLPVERPTKFELVINLKTRNTDRIDDSTQCSGSSGQSDSMTEQANLEAELVLPGEHSRLKRAQTAREQEHLPVCLPDPQHANAALPAHRPRRSTDPDRRSPRPAPLS